MGMTFVIATGGIDISQGSVIAISGAICCSLDKSGNIGGDESGTVGNAYNSEIRRQRGKMIVCNFRTGCRDNRENCRLAYIRVAYKSDVRNHFKL